ncbi:Fur family transcriptional regulator, partial [bacterium]
ITEGVLEETEKIEHTISSQTVNCLADFISFFKNRPKVIREFEMYRKTKGKPG